MKLSVTTDILTTSKKNIFWAMIPKGELTSLCLAVYGTCTVYKCTCTVYIKCLVVVMETIYKKSCGHGGCTVSWLEECIMILFCFSRISCLPNFSEVRVLHHVHCHDLYCHSEGRQWSYHILLRHLWLEISQGQCDN